MAVIETRDLTYIYGRETPFEKVALDKVCLKIEQGEFVGIIGHTGSGKSTLVQHLNGLLRPASGQVFINGRDIWQNPKDIRQVRFEVGLVFQYPEYQLFEETCFADIAFGPKNMGLGEAEIRERVLASARFVGLREELLDKSPFDLSGGEKRRVAIAGVLAMEPDVLILDEPTAGLDPQGRDLILGQIRAYQKQKNATVLLVSHSMEDVAKTVNRVLVMHKSRVAMYGSVSEVFTRGRELLAMDLEVPQITRIFMELKEKGYPVSDSVFTVEQARDEILRLVRGGTCS